MSQAPSQSSVSTPTLPGKCVVCSKDSNRRCSACASHGLDFIFFCSEDHQKLVWSVHKRVCGQFAQPFRWPALTQTELDELVAMGTQTCRDDDGNVTTLDEYVNSVPKRDDSPSFAEVFQSYRAQAWDTRSSSGVWLEKKPTFQETLDLMVQHPFDFLASLELSVVSEYAHKLDAELPSWWTPLQHKIVILMAISCAQRKNKNAGTYYILDLHRHRVRAYDEAVRYCTEVVKSFDSEFADQMVTEVLSFFRPPQ
ncbi:hypothetical protein JCM5353_005092 [Sporobolomyces roseus]